MIEEARIKELEAQNKQLKQEVRCLNVKLSDESNNATILAEKLNEMNHAHKHLRKENAKLKCLALHAMRDLFDYKGHKLNREGYKIWGKYCHKYNEFDKAYRKAKAEMMEKK